MRTQKYYRHKKQTHKKRRHKKTRQRGASSNYGSQASQHRFQKELKQDSTSLIGNTLYTQESKGFIPEIKPYPLEKISDEVLARMGFEDVVDVVGEDVANPEDFRRLKRLNSMEETVMAASKAGMAPLTERTRLQTEIAAKAAAIAPGAIGQSSKVPSPASDPASDHASGVFTDLGGSLND